VSKAPDTVVCIAALELLDPDRPLEELAIKGFWGNSAAPAEIYLASSCEGNILEAPRTQQTLRAMQKCFQGIPVSLVHQGCASFYAAVLRFAASASHRVLVLCDENDVGLGQSCLDTAGIGIGAVEQGLRAASGRALVLLERKPMTAVAHDEVCVRECRIFAKQRGMQGTQLILQQIRILLEETTRDGLPAVVSFSIDAPWSRSLLHGLDTLANHWLPSAESATNHLLSLKPLRELRKHRHLLKHRDLLLMTLSGGGRFGFLRVTRSATAANAHALPVPEEIHLAEESVPRASRGVRPINYVDLAYRGIHDLVFVASVDVRPT
jgi:hypothetical protein